MIVSYRTRRFFSRLGRFLVIFTAIALALLLCWLLWLQRFVRYTQDGVVLDFGISNTLPQGQLAKPIEPGATVGIHYGNEEETLPSDQPEMERLTGYYITVQELLEDLAGVEQKLRDLPKGTAVLMDVKGGVGAFYYPTSVGTTTSTSFDMDTMEAFFDTVNSLGLYTIARLPAFRDYTFGLANVSCGLPAPAGYLWADRDNYYWLNPTNDIVLTYLIQIAKELQGLGFDEVVFQNFCFPDTDGIVFGGDRQEAINKAAATIATACAATDLTVSFVTSDPAFQLPEGKTRLYLENVAAADVADVLLRYTVTDPQTQLVFFAQVGDTRYDVAGVLRPLDMAY